MTKKLDIQQVEKFLKSLYKKDFDAKVEKVGKGQWSQTFFFEVGGKGFVLRFKDGDIDIKRDALGYELFGNKLPVPKIVSWGKVFGGFYVITERLYGEYLDDVSSEQGKTLVPEILNLLDALRTEDVNDKEGFGPWEADGNAKFATWVEYLLSVDQEQSHMKGWRENLERSKFGMRDFDKLYQILEREIINYPEVRSVVHSDLLYFNVLVKKDKISAVLDWGCAKYGDFVHDLAWFEFWKPWHKGLSDIDFVAEAKRHYDKINLEVPMLEKRLRVSMIHMALDSISYSAFRNRPENWKFVEELLGHVKLVSNV